MNWTLNNIRIFVDKASGEGKQIIPTLQPLAGGTIPQFYGYESATHQISGLIVGTLDLLALLSYRTTAISYVLNSPEGTLGDMYVKDVKYSRVMCISQTMRPDLPCESPVFSVDLTLLPTVSY